MTTGTYTNSTETVQDSTNQHSSHQSFDTATSDHGDPNWHNRDATRGRSCEPEPLDSADDCYGLHKSITSDLADVGRDRYLGDDGEPLTHFEAVGEYLKRRTTDSTCRTAKGWFNGRQGTAESQYSEGMALDRYLLDTFDNPTLTMLSLRVSPDPQNRLRLLESLAEGIDHTLYKLRRRLEQDSDAPFSPDEWEYQLVFAATAEHATPHCHVLVYTDGDVSRDRFADVVEWFVQKCEHAPDDGSGNSPELDGEGLAQAVSIRGTDETDPIPRVDSDSCDIDLDTVAGRHSAGATYCLQQLPHLGSVGAMARDELLHSMVCDASRRSAYRSSVNRDAIPNKYFDSSTSNLARDDPSAQTRMGSYEERETTASEEEETQSCESFDARTGNLWQSEREFVDQYMDAPVGAFSDTIVDNIHENRDEFDCIPNTNAIVRAIHDRCLNDEELEFVNQYLDANAPTDSKTIRDNIDNNSAVFDKQPNKTMIEEVIMWRSDES